MNTTTQHTITVKAEGQYTVYCAECGRNIGSRGHGTPATGTWPTGTPATFAIHKSTPKADLVARGF